MGLLKLYAALACAAVLGYLFGLLAGKLVRNEEEKYAVARGQIKLRGKTYMLTELWDNAYNQRL